MGVGALPVLGAVAGSLGITGFAAHYSKKGYDAYHEQKNVYEERQRQARLEQEQKLKYVSLLPLSKLCFPGNYCEWLLDRS